jgi:hypothetical protein
MAVITADEVIRLVEEALATIGDPAVAQEIRALLVRPYPVVRAWDYGGIGESYVCWTVLEHSPSNTGIAFCPEGFGPASPWGLVFLSGPHVSIGTDASWYTYLEDAFRESQAWQGSNPPGYQVP